MSFQNLIIVGNLGRDVELRYSPNGDPVASLNVATNRVYTDANNQKVKETTWFKVSVWGKMAQNCNDFLKKGSVVLVEGELRPDKETGNPHVFTRQDGTTGASYEVFAHQVRFLSGKNEQQPVEELNDGDVPF